MAYQPPGDDCLDWVGRQVGAGAKVGEVTRLHGGITAAMDRIEVWYHDRLQSVVLRRWIGDRRHDHPDTESNALEAVARHGIPAPRLIAVDPEGQFTGTPSVLMTVVDGEPNLAPTDLDDWIDQLAAMQVGIHRVPISEIDGWADQRRREGWFSADRQCNWIADEGLRADALAIASRPPVDESVFVHGDYQHFNVLWQDQKLTGVVDWPSAGVGLPGIDVGHCRLNLAVLFSAAAAESYLDRYQQLSGADLDVRALLRALLVWDEEWKKFIPTQVNGRTTVDLDGMAGRVAETVRQTLRRFG